MGLLFRIACYTSIGAFVGYKLNKDFYVKFYDTTPIKGSAAAVKYAEKLETKQANLSIVKTLTRDPQFHMIRPWDYIKEDRAASVFTTGPLHTPGGISIPPIVFANEEEKCTVTVFHGGHFLSGFPFLVHGGILSTALDEALHRTASLSIGKYPHHEKVNIKLSYKRPTLVGQFLVIKTSTEVIEEGKKARIVGSVQNLKGQELVTGEGVFDVSDPGQTYGWKSMVGL